MRAVAVVSVLVGIAVLAATVVVGRAEISREPLDPAFVALEDLSWAERASAACVDATASVQLVLRSGGFESAGDRAVRLYVETTRIQGRLLETLRALPARPAGAAEVLRTLGAQHRRDLRTAASLARSFDAQLLQGEIVGYERTAAALLPRFEELGATGCVAYLDPATYEDA